MPEIDETADGAEVAPTGHEPTPLDEPASVLALDDELDLEVIEGLAEEAHARAEGAPRASDTEPHRALDAPALLDAIKGQGEQLGRRLDLLQTTFERELRAEATRERVVDRLHAELQDYKQDFLLKVQRPIFIDLIQLHDDIGKMIDARKSSEQDSERAGDLRGVLVPIQTAIEDILYRQGVEPFAVEGTDFDPRKQRAVSTQATDDPALSKQVATRLRKGFCSGDKLIRPEIVTVFTFRPAPSSRSE
jgi:molecular chaperone GrpE